MSNPKKVRTPCLNCGKEPYGHTYKYCSNACQHEYQYQAYIQDWKQGRNKGLRANGLVSRPVKRYLREKFGNRCCSCGWLQVNVVTGIVPLVADHIDGNWRNNVESNLRLICPNCDALGSTYAGLNRGRGRADRPASKRAIIARDERWK